MTRPKKNPLLMREMCIRFSVVIDLLERRDVRLSEALGYSNQATLGKVRRCQAFVDTERLALLGLMTVDGVATPNLHWILTGYGKPFLPKSPTVEMDVVDALSLLALRSAKVPTKN